MPQIFKKFSILISFFLFFPLLVFAETFFTDPNYDFQNREKIFADLKYASVKAYFFVESEWWINLTEKEKQEVLQNISNLAKEFDEVIYPKLTSIFGFEWKPGIDGEERISILFHRMKEGVGGYFNSGDEYPKIQNPKSNQREMVYLNSDNLFNPLIKSFLAHEFLHLITFNQKTKKFGVEEEVWLNEMRAECAPTILGYDLEEKSNLAERIKFFLNNPSDSLTEWQNQKADYGVINLFCQYLLDHFGPSVLSLSLKSSKVGIPSLDEALKRFDYQKNFSQVFADWLVALYLGDCNLGPNFCYKNEKLKNLKITPSLIFLPTTQITQVNLTYSIKDWSGNWYRIFGGKGDLVLEFDGQDGEQFNVSMVLCKNTQTCQVQSLNLDEKQRGKLVLEKFDQNWSSLTIIPFVETKKIGFGEREIPKTFFLSISIKQETEKEKLIQELLKEIERLKKEIEFYQEKIKEILAEKEKVTCSKLERDLYFGLTNDPDVYCLQKFLKLQGSEIYPEGLVTGNFFGLTKQAVIRFQEKYKDEILKPLGLEKGTGYVGFFTRQKINQLLQQTFSF